VTPNKVREFDEFLSHEKRWNDINKELMRSGYSMTWLRVVEGGGYRYTLTRFKPYEKLGYYDDMETAINMARMILSQAQIEG
jgi:hypothetical protein